MKTLVQEVAALEAARLQAVSSGDLAAVAELMDEDLFHVHVTGQVQNRAAFLEGLARQPRQTQRQSLDIRLLSDKVALLTGEVSNTLVRPGASAPETVSMVVTQVARRADDGRWRFVSFHACRRG